MAKMKKKSGNGMEISNKRLFSDFINEASAVWFSYSIVSRHTNDVNKSEKKRRK